MIDEPPVESTQPSEHPEVHTATRCVRSEDLLQGSRELLIAHGQELYRLRLTRSGKLILGK